MANVPPDLRYTSKHEYLKPAAEPGVYYVGITDYAQRELGEVVFVELPPAGDLFEADAVFGSVETVKAVAELFSPIDGEVVASNDAVDADPALVNSDPYGAGWMIQLRATNPAQVDGLLDAAQYSALIGG